LKLSLNTGETRRLVARAVKGDGLEPVPDPVEWATSDPKVVKVDPASGLVTTTGPGSATVSVTWGKFTDKLDVQVEAPEPPATGVKIIT
jgi:uncharacterized protein YjdB